VGCHAIAAHERAVSLRNFSLAASSSAVLRATVLREDHETESPARRTVSFDAAAHKFEIEIQVEKRRKSGRVK
jgi:hypothetical protein